MKFFFRILTFAVIVFSLSLSFNCFSQSKHKISLSTEKPIWGNNLHTLNMGNWIDYVSNGSEQPEQIIGFLYIGNGELNINPPFREFIFLTVDNQNVFLKFNNVKKYGKRFIQVWENGNIKITLDYNGISYNQSGNGKGGILNFYYNNILQKKYEFFEAF